MTISFQTEVVDYQNGAQKRYIGSAGLVKFELPYSAMTKTQKNTLLAFISSAKGRFTNNLQLTLGSTTYANLRLDSDSWTATEAETMQYAGPVKVSQEISQGLATGTPGQPFPTLANGAMGILPYGQTKRFQTIFQKVPAGPGYAFAEFAGGLTNYPTDGLMSWTLQESGISDADLATRIGHFVANYGRGYEFSFTDEDGTTYTKVVYASDDLVVKYTGPNNSSVSIALTAINS